MGELYPPFLNQKVIICLKLTVLFLHEFPAWVTTKCKPFLCKQENNFPEFSIKFLSRRLMNPAGYLTNNLKYY